MPDDSQQERPGPPEVAAGLQKKKRRWPLACCIGCSVAFLTLVVAGLLYFSLATAFLRELIERR